MSYTRPQSVPPDATLIYPGQTFGPGAAVQQATIGMQQAIIARQNAMANFNYTRALADWEANKVQYEAYHLRVPPAPVAPPQIALQIVYADQGGTVVSPPEGADGLHAAWIWETTESTE